MLVQLIYCLSASVTFTLCAYVFDGSLFAWHPTFMLVGFVGVMTLGVVRSITFRKLDGKARVKAIQIHAFLQTLALSCMSGGLGCIVQNKCGAFTALLAVSAIAGGLLAFKKLRFIYLFPERLHSKLKWLHRNLGLLTYLSALTTIEVALTHTAVYKAIWTQLWQMTIAVLGVAMLKLALQQDRGKLLVLQPLSADHPGKLQ